MARFNNRSASAPEKSRGVRVCLFVDPDIYRMMRAACIIDGTNVSQWFNEKANEHLQTRRTGPPMKPAKRTLTRARR